MSKARLVITAVTVEGRPVAEVARAYGVARSWIYTLMARYLAMAENAHARVTEVNAPHLAMISDPGVVTSVILQAVHATA